MKLIIHKDVDAFITTLQKPTQGKWLRSLILLEVYGKNLGMPHARRLTSNLSELRIRGNQEVRAFFTVDDDQVRIIHAFVKKTQKIPQREIEIAENRLKRLTEV